MDTDISDFFEAVLWVQDNPDNPDRMEGATVHQVHPEMIRLAGGFISGFRAFLEKGGFDMERLDAISCSFGGNVYFSLSGHGCGFFDEYPPDDREIGDELQALLEKYAGTRYQFEQLESQLMRTGDVVDLAFIPSAVAEYREKMFAVAPPK